MTTNGAVPPASDQFTNTPPDIPDGSVSARWKIVVMAVMIVAALLTGFLILTLTVQPKFAFLCALLSFFGAVGGLLYGVRESELVAPQFTSSGIKLGWISDCFYGLAGAFAIFLILPNFSESAIENLDGIISPLLVYEATVLTAGRTSDSQSANAVAVPERKGGGADDGPQPPKKNNGADLVEMIAVAIIGGYAGRFVVQRASDTLLHKVEAVQTNQYQLEKTMSARQEELKREFEQRETQMRAEFAESQTQLRVELDAARADSEALSLAAQQLNPQLANPDPNAYVLAFCRASLDGKTRVFDFVAHRVRTEKRSVAAQAVPMLEQLRQWCPEALGREIVLVQAEALGYVGAEDRGAQLLDEVLRALPHAISEEYLSRVQTVQTRLLGKAGRDQRPVRAKVNGIPR